jgi:hypothetical protein
MSKVYIVFRHNFSEFDGVVGVFNTKAKALNHAEKLKKEYQDIRISQWNKMSVHSKKACGPRDAYINDYRWTVEDHSLI